MPFQDLVYTSWVAQGGVALTIPEVAGGSSAILAVTGMRSGTPGRHPATLDTSPVKPGAAVITPVVRVPTREDASQILSILKLVWKNDRSVGVVDHVLAKNFFVFKNVMDEPTKKQDVRSGAQRSPNVCHGGGAAEARIDVNDLGTALSRFDHPLETDRVILRHVRAHNQDGIRIYEIARRSCSSTSAEGGAQTGHRGAVSYTGLVADADHAQAGRKELFDQVVFFVIESRATKVRHGSRMHYDLSITLFLERALPRVPDAIGDHVHRRLQFQLLPPAGVRPAILYARFPVRVRQQFEAIGPLWAKPPAGNKRI